MNPEWLQAFVTFAQTPSLEAAALALGTTQPTLTRQLKALEESLGASLFSMQGRRKVLTQTGQELLIELRPRFEGLSESVTRVVRQMNDPAKMTLRLGARREVLASYATRIPFAGHLRMKFLGHAEIIEGLLTRSLDVGITHELPDSLNISAVPLFKDQFKLCYPKSWRLEKSSFSKTLAALVSGRPFLAYDDKLHPLRGLVEDLSALRISLTCADWGIVSSMVVGGLGWTLMPESLIPANGVEVLDLPKDVEKPVQFYLIYLKEFGRQDWFKKFAKELRAK